jgi:hypothetical protein
MFLPVPLSSPRPSSSSLSALPDRPPNTRGLGWDGAARARSRRACCCRCCLSGWAARRSKDKSLGVSFLDAGLGSYGGENSRRGERLLLMWRCNHGTGGGWSVRLWSGCGDLLCQQVMTRVLCAPWAVAVWWTLEPSIVDLPRSQGWLALSGPRGEDSRTRWLVVSA